MSWEKIASSASASASEAITHLASQALEDFLSDENQSKVITDIATSSATSASEAVAQSTSQSVEDFLKDQENSVKDD
jgi:hypothetical protein